MTMWILIIMVLGDGKAMTQVTGYTSIYTCLEAGIRAKEHFSPSPGFQDWSNTLFYTCVPAPKEK